MARPKLQLRIAQSPVLRYGLAVPSVSVALGAALLIERLQVRNITLFLFAIAVAEKSSREVLSLPVYPELTDEQQDRVVQGIVDFYARKKQKSAANLGKWRWLG